MSLEKNIERIANALEAMAILQQQLVANQNGGQEVQAPVATPTATEPEDGSPLNEGTVVQPTVKAKRKSRAKVKEPVEEPELKEPEPDSVSKEDLRNAIRKCIVSQGKPKTIEILTKYGYDAEKRDIDVEKYEDAIEELEG